jgi:hypothetical protein
VTLSTPTTLQPPYSGICAAHPGTEITGFSASPPT